jgi:hypothetical protein
MKMAYSVPGISEILAQKEGLGGTRVPACAEGTIPKIPNKAGLGADTGGAAARKVGVATSSTRRAGKWKAHPVQVLLVALYCSRSPTCRTTLQYEIQIFMYTTHE